MKTNEAKEIQNWNYFKTMLDDFTRLIMEGKLDSGGTNFDRSDLIGMDRVLALLMVKQTELQERIAYQNDEMINLLKGIVEGDKLEFTVNNVVTDETTVGVEDVENLDGGIVIKEKEA